MDYGLLANENVTVFYLYSFYISEYIDIEIQWISLNVTHWVFNILGTITKTQQQVCCQSHELTALLHSLLYLGEVKVPPGLFGDGVGSEEGG